ncbi:MAG: cupin domain-containing protein [Clostridia bacterium]|nr:cupin domain-containing protein [Clostridia bacterium]
MNTNTQIKQIAERIKELRDILDMSSAQVAQEVGIPEEEYMLYEEAKADIPVSVLYAVAAALGVDTTVLLTGETPRMEGYTVVRDGKGVEVERYAGYKFASLAANFIGREMEPMIVTLNKGDKPAELVYHTGQEINFVLEGTVMVTIGKKTITLEKGDSVYFDAMQLHSQQALTETAKFLTVINENAKGLK